MILICPNNVFAMPMSWPTIKATEQIRPLLLVCLVAY